MKYCIKCGNQLSENASFCPNCGYHCADKTEGTGNKTDNTKKYISDVFSIISICSGGLALILSVFRIVFIWAGIIGIVISVIGMILSRSINGKADIKPIIGLILSIAAICIIPVVSCTNGVEGNYFILSEILS